MATAQDIINRALRLCKVIDAYSAPTAEDSADALDTLNAMLAEWHEADIGLPDYELAGLTAELATDAADREAIAYQLALRIAPEYGEDLTPAVYASAHEAMSRLRLRYFQPMPAEAALPRTRHVFDIDLG